MCGTHQPVAGVTDERRTGVADQRHVISRGKLPQQPFDHLFLVVIVQGDEPGSDTEMRQQLLAVTGILGCNERHGSEYLCCTGRPVLQVANRCGNHEQFPCTGVMRAHAERIVSGMAAIT